MLIYTTEMREVDVPITFTSERCANYKLYPTPGCVYHWIHAISGDSKFDFDAKREWYAAFLYLFQSLLIE